MWTRITSRLALLGLLSVVMLLPIPVSRAAAPLASPQGEVVLQVLGDLERTNSEEGGARFDRRMLEDLGLHQIKTSSDWTDGTPSFEGPLVRDLLARIGANGTTVVARAHNDYAVEIPVSDFLEYPVILALTMNGERLSLRDKGPIWIIYPRDRFPELRDSVFNARWIWQLRELVVR